MEHATLKEDIVSTARQLEAYDLGIGHAGNLSARSAHGFIITPSGIENRTLSVADLVECDPTGQVLHGSLSPSSETPFHQAIYQARPEINAIVHAHPPYATAIACTRQAIPAFHYMVAIAGTPTIPCARYASFGTERLSHNILDALGAGHACLLANHGIIALGQDIWKAFQLAREVENLAKQYSITKQLGDPVLLNEEEMKRIIHRLSHYGQ